MMEDTTNVVNVREVLNCLSAARKAMVEADSARLTYEHELRDLRNRANGYRTQAEREKNAALTAEVRDLDERCAELNENVCRMTAEKRKRQEEIARLEAIKLPEQGLLDLAAEKYCDARNATQTLETQKRDLTEARDRAAEAKRKAVAGISQAEGAKRNALSLGDVASANAALAKARAADADVEALISNIDSRLRSLPDALEKAKSQLRIEEAGLWSACFDAIAAEVLTHEAMPQLTQKIARAHAALLKSGGGASLEQCIARIITKGFGAESSPEQVAKLQAEMAVEIGVA